MARKLKVFRTSLGFFDLAIAAPSPVKLDQSPKAGWQHSDLKEAE